MTGPVLWWVSWEERDSPDDSRPLKDPPGPWVLAWWCTGYAGDGSFATMVALVHARDKKSVAKAVDADWPAKKARRWRFRHECTDYKEGVLTLSDRFPLKPWSTKRLELLDVKVLVKS